MSCLCRARLRQRGVPEGGNEVEWPHIVPSQCGLSNRSYRGIANGTQRIQHDELLDDDAVRMKTECDLVCVGDMAGIWRHRVSGELWYSYATLTDSNYFGHTLHMRRVSDNEAKELFPEFNPKHRIDKNKRQL